jgi:hypothetical protein
MPFAGIQLEENLRLVAPIHLRFLTSKEHNTPKRIKIEPWNITLGCLISLLQITGPARRAEIVWRVVATLCPWNDVISVIPIGTWLIRGRSIA